MPANELPSTQLDQILKAIDAASSLQLGKIGQLESKVDGKFNEIHDQIDTISSNIKGVNDKVDSVQGDVALLNSRLNDLEQEKLSNILEIVGASDKELESCNGNYRALVAAIFKLFNIPHNDTKIEHVRLREVVSIKKKIIVVVFKSFTDKIEAIIAKRQSTVSEPIFFDHAMTPTTRFLFLQARRIAKDARVKGPIISAGRILITLRDGTRRKISQQADIDALRDCMPAATLLSNNMMQPTTSSQSNTFPPQKNHVRHFIDASQNNSPPSRLNL